MSNTTTISDVFSIEPFTHLVKSYHHARYPHSQRPAVLTEIIELDEDNEYKVVLVINIRQDDGNYRRYLFGMCSRYYSEYSFRFSKYRRIQKKYFGVDCFLKNPDELRSLGFPRPVSLKFHTAGGVFSFDDDNDLLLDYLRWKNDF